MLQAGKMIQIANTLKSYKLDLIALQEIRWEGSGYIKKPEYTIYYIRYTVLQNRDTMGQASSLAKNSIDVC